jgi:hypothetical protein
MATKWNFILAMLVSCGVATLVLPFMMTPAEAARSFPTGAIPVKHQPQSYAWYFQAEATNTDVILKLDDRTFDIGEFAGKCFEIGGPGTTPLLEGELIGAQCWSSKGGDEIGVFRDSDRLRVAHVRLQTRSDYRPDFGTLLEL